MGCFFQFSNDWFCTHLAAVRNACRKTCKNAKWRKPTFRLISVTESPVSESSFARNVQPFIQQSLPESSSVELLGNPHQLPFADKKAFSDIFCGKLTHKARIYQIIQSGYPIDISVDTRHLHSRAGPALISVPALPQAKAPIEEPAGMIRILRKR